MNYTERIAFEREYNYLLRSNWKNKYIKNLIKNIFNFFFFYNF